MTVPWRIQWRGFLVGAGSVILIGSMLLGCRKADESAPTPEWVVQVGTQKVAAATFEADWSQRQSQQERPVPAGDVIGALVSDWQAYQAAGQMGLLEDPELQKAIRRVIAGKVRESLSKSLSKPLADAPIGPMEIETVYRSQPQRWQRPPAWNIAWLVASVSPRPSRPDGLPCASVWKAIVARFRPVPIPRPLSPSCVPTIPMTPPHATSVGNWDGCSESNWPREWGSPSPKKPSC